MDTNASGSTLEQQFTQLQAQVVAMAIAQGGANAVQKGFPDAPIFDSGKAEELCTWIIQLLRGSNKHRISRRWGGGFLREVCHH